METITLKITGMHCTSCAMNIDFEIEDIEGVTEVATHYAKQQTVVTFDSQKTTLGQIIQIIQSLEYNAELIS